MKNEIIVNLTGNHEYKCNCIIIARKNENHAARFKIIVPEELKDKWLYIDFEKKSGAKIKTPRIEINADGIGYYDICNNLTDEVGKIKAEIIFQDEKGYVWKSFVKIYQIVDAICATEEIEKENPDFITEAQKLLDEIKNGGTGGSGGGTITDVQVDGVSVVTDGIANIDFSNVTELDEVLRDILEAIQTGETSSMIIEEIERLIVSYFENKTVEEVEL